VVKNNITQQLYAETMGKTQ